MASGFPDWFNADTAMTNVGMGQQSFGITPDTPTSGFMNMGVNPKDVFNNLDPSSNIHKGLVAKIGGAARGLASWLEPLQLPQDLLFAAVAGLADPTSTFTSRFTHDQGFWHTLENYLPGGAAPQRPATGAEILNLFGVDNAMAQKIGGFALDLTADPLLIGGFLKGAGLAAKGLGTLGKVGELADTGKQLALLGERFDQVMNPLALYKVAPAGLRSKMEQTSSRFVTAMLNKKVPWNTGEGASLIGDVIAPRRTALGVQFSKVIDPLATQAKQETGRTVAGIHNVTAGEEMAAIQSRAQAMGKLTQERVAQLGGDAAQALNAPLSDAPSQKRWLGGLFKVLEKQRAASDAASTMPQVLRSHINSAGWQFMDKHGAFVLGKNAVTPEIQQLITDASKATQTDLFSKSQTAMADFIGGVRKKAVQVGVDPELAAQRATTFVQRAAEADALAGYYESGMDYVRTKVLSRASEVLGSESKASQLWGDMLTAGLQGNYEDWMKAASGYTAKDAVAFTAQGARAAGESAGQAASKVGGTVETAAGAATGTAEASKAAKELTNRQLLGSDFENFIGLPISDYLSGLLANGHLRRSYAMLQDAPGFKRYIKSVDTGKVFINNVVNQAMDGIDPKFANEAKLTSDLLDTIGSAGKTAVVSKYDIVQHLLDNGVTARQTKDFLAHLVEVQNPHLQPTLQKIQGWADQLSHASSSPQKAFGVYGRQAFIERSNLTPEDLLALGEFRQPLVSVSEQANLARTRVPVTQYMQQVYELGKQHGYIQDAPNYVDPISKVRYTQIPASEIQTWGSFAGKYIHPYLKKELLQAMTNRGANGGWLSRLRNLITGGYLASPNVLAANVASGFFQMAGLGISPAEAAASMARTLKPILEHDSGKKSYWVLDRLAQAFDINESTLIGQNYIKQLDNLRLTQAGTKGGDAKGFLDNLTSFLEDQLRAPGKGIIPDNPASKLLGLDGFQFSERWMKVAAFDAAYNRFKNIEGLSEGLAQKSAAELSRLAVFDYSEIPQALRTLRNTGVLMFPGFNYFLIPRAVRATLTRPGVMSTANRFSDAVSNTVLSPDEKAAMYASMPDWLQQEHGSVVTKYTGKDGTERYVAIPMNQVVPTDTLAGNPWGDSLMSMGIYRPFQEVLAAAIRGDGQAIFSGRYGQQVYDAGASTGGKILQSAEFLMSNLLPGSVRKLGLDPQSVRQSFFDQTRTPNGIVPKLFQTVFHLPEDMGKTMYSFSEATKGKPDRTLRDNVMAATLRSPTVLALDGPLASFNYNYKNASRQHSTELTQLRKRIQAAAYYKNQPVLDKLVAEYEKKQVDFANTWGAMSDVVSKARALNSSSTAATP